MLLHGIEDINRNCSPLKFADIQKPKTWKGELIIQTGVQPFPILEANETIERIKLEK